MPDVDSLHREVQRTFEEHRKAADEFTNVMNDGPLGSQDGVLLIQQVAKANSDSLRRYIDALKRYNDAIEKKRQAGESGS